MWIPKWVRDRKRGVDSPIPTQAVSNGEFIPRPQTRQQRQVEALTAEYADEKSKRLGLDRRTFMASGMDTLVLGDHVVDKRAVTGGKDAR